MDFKVVHDIDEIGKRRWNNFLRQSPASNAFHSYEWLKSLQDGEGLPARHFVCFKSGTIIGVFPHFLTPIRMLPFSRLDGYRPGCGGPIVVYDERNVMDAFMEGVRKELSGRVINHRVVLNEPYFIRYNQYFIEHGYELDVSRSSVYLPLDGGLDTVLGNMSKKRRQSFKNIRDFDVRVVEKTADDISTFYGIHSVIMEKYGVPAFKPSLYQALAEQFGDKMVLFMANVDGETIGAYLLIEDEYKNSIRCVFGGVLPDKLKTGCNDSMHRSIIEYAVDRGYSEINLGGANASFENGLFTYKEDLGTKLRQIYLWSCGGSLWSVLKMGEGIIRGVKFN